MTALPPGIPDKPVYTVADLMRVTGLGRDTVRAAIRTGELPGYRIGRQYRIPREAFIAFCNGTWVPSFRPVFTQEIKAIVPIRRRLSA